MRATNSIFGAGLFCAASASFGQAAPPTAPATATSVSPVRSFLVAADTNNFEAMLPLIVGKVLVGGAQNISGQDFLKKIAPCYLRRVYKNDQSGELLATWMCAEGQSKSRVVIAKVAEATAGVALTVELEQRNARPAPARVESAFANERN